MRLSLTLKSQYTDWSWVVGIELLDWNPKLQLGRWVLQDSKWVNLLAMEIEGLYTKQAIPDQGMYVGQQLKLWDISEKKPAFCLFAAPAHPKDADKDKWKMGYGMIQNARSSAAINYDLEWVYLWD